MWIRKAVAWLFDVGDGRESNALQAARSSEVRDEDRRDDDATEGRLYGEAEAIRVLYQTSNVPTNRPKPRRPTRGHRHRSWLERYQDALSPSLPTPAGAQA